MNVVVADSKDQATGIFFRSFAGVGAIPHLRGVGYAGNGATPSPATPGPARGRITA